MFPGVAHAAGIEEHRASYLFLSHQNRSTSSIRMLGTPFGGVTGFTHRRRASLTWRRGGVVHRLCPGLNASGPRGSQGPLSDFTNSNYASYVIVLEAFAKSQHIAQ